MTRRLFSGRLARCLALPLLAFAVGRDGRTLCAGELSEYQVKAAYLYNFAKFVEWPADAFDSPSAPLVIGVYGNDPFGPSLDTLLRDKSVSGRRFVIRRSTRMQDLRNSHIVFVGDSREAVPALLGSLAGGSVLTVGQSPGFLRDGGIVMFQIDGGRVVFSIDAVAAAKAHLTLSSQLLRLSFLNQHP